MTEKQINIVEKVLVYIFVLCLILSMGAMCFHIEYFMNRGIRQLDLINFECRLALILSMIQIVKYKASMTIRNVVILVLSCLFLRGYFYVIPANLQSFNEEYFKPFIYFFILVALTKREKRMDMFFKTYSNIVFVIAVISLFFYIFGETFHLIEGTEIRYWNQNEWNPGKSYFHLYYVNYYQNRGFTHEYVVRNIGPFMEAPGFALPLTFALWYDLFARKKRNIIRMIVICTAMITTVSMKAYIIGIVLFAMYFYFEYAKKDAFIRRLFTGLGLSVVVVAAWLFLYIFLIDGSSVSGLGSIGWRMQDTMAAFKTWLYCPFLGCGYDNSVIMRGFYLDSANVGYTAGLLNVLAYGGVYWFAFYCIALFGYILEGKRHNSIVMKLSFVVTILIFLFITSMQYREFMIFLLVLGLSYIGDLKTKQSLVVLRGELNGLT